MSPIINENLVFGKALESETINSGVSTIDSAANGMVEPYESGDFSNYLLYSGVAQAAMFDLAIIQGSNLKLNRFTALAVSFEFTRRFPEILRNDELINLVYQYVEEHYGARITKSLTLEEIIKYNTILFEEFVNVNPRARAFVRIASDRFDLLEKQKPEVFRRAK
jgi:hypothetical protein